MQKNYTEELKVNTQEEMIERGPRVSTVNFLKQFARAYMPTGINEPGLEGFVAN